MTTPYTTGSITLTNGSAVVTGVGTAWQTALIAGGTIYVEADGNPLPILAVGSNTQITAAIKWKGANGTYPYAIKRDTAYGQQTVANAQALSSYLQRLDNASLSALASVAPAADRLPYFTGDAAAALTPLTAFARTLLDDPNAAAMLATLGAFSSSGGVVTGLGPTPEGGVMTVRNNLASTGLEPVAAFRIARQNSTTPASILGVDGNNNAVVGSNNSTLRLGKFVNAAFSEYMRVNSNGKVQMSISGNIGNVYGDLMTSRTSVPVTGVSANTAAYFGVEDANCFVQLVGGQTALCDVVFGHPDSAGQGRVRYNNSVNRMQFWTSGAVSMEIFDDGTLRSVPSYNATSASAANMFIASNGAIVRSTSSGQYKTQVEDLWPNYADTILEMRPVWYRSLCPIDNPDWSYIGMIAEEVGAIEPRLVHWRTEDIVTETVEKQVAVSVERPVEREVQVTRTEYLDTGLLDDEGKPLFKAVERTETIVEIDMVTVEEVQTITETEHRSVPLPEPVAEGIMYDRLVVHLIAHAQRQHEKIETLAAQMTELLARVEALEWAGQAT